MTKIQNKNGTFSQNKKYSDDFKINKEWNFEEDYLKTVGKGRFLLKLSFFSLHLPLGTYWTLRH